MPVDVVNALCSGEPMLNVVLSPEILGDIRSAASLKEADAALRAHGVMLPRAQVEEVFGQVHEGAAPRPACGCPALLDDADLLGVSGGADALLDDGLSGALGDVLDGCLGGEAVATDAEVTRGYVVTIGASTLR